MGYCASYLYLFGGNGHAKKGEVLINDCTHSKVEIEKDQWVKLKTRQRALEVSVRSPLCDRISSPRAKLGRQHRAGRPTTAT